VTRGRASDGTVRLWDVTTRQVIAVLQTFGSANGVAFSRDGKILATAGSDGTVLLWDLATRRLMASLHVPASNSSTAPRQPKYCPAIAMTAVTAGEPNPSVQTAQVGSEVTRQD
jgi:WD40 repeat protein